MEKTSNNRKSKLEINSLEHIEHILFEDLVEHKSDQIRGGYSNGLSLHTPDEVFPLEDKDPFVTMDPFIVILPIIDFS